MNFWIEAVLLCLVLVLFLEKIYELIKDKKEEKIKTQIFQNQIELALQRNFQTLNETLRKMFSDHRLEQHDLLHKIMSLIHQNLNDLSRDQQTLLKSIRDDLFQNLSGVRRDNEEKLEKMRLTVEKKLHETIENRLTQSFQTVSHQLEQVYRGLGDMQSLAKGVGDLKSVLTNVKLRGNYGEVQLIQLVEDVLVRDHYEINFSFGTQERVDLAIKMPGHHGPVYLPVDSKFPQEDFLKIQQADTLDPSTIEQARKSLRQRILDEAQKIHKKYIQPPQTTDFAVLFLPSEALYAEVLRLPEIFETLQSMKIMLAGPSTFLALLHSLQVGFRAFAIQKRSKEVWDVLGAVKAEFEKFGDSLDVVSKKIQEASFKMDETSKRTRAISRKLKSVEQLEDFQNQSSNLNEEAQV